MRRGFSLIAAAGGFALLHCSSLPEPCQGAACDAPSDGSSGDGGSDVNVPPGCDPTAEPKDAPKCVVDDFGIFVDASGDDGKEGTRTSPVKSIGAALRKAGGSRQRVYICGEGPFAEHVKLTSSVPLYGGFACGTWSYSGTKARVAPSDAGYALEIANVSASVTLADLAFEAPPATADRRSSIAVFVAKSSARLVRIAATAKEGRDGASGTTGSNYDSTLTAGNDKIAGSSTTTAAGAPQQECLQLCTNGIHATGGKGGNGDPTPTGGAKGGPDLGAGAGGLVGGNCGGGGIGGIGNPAPPAANATAGTSTGTLTEAGWTPADGVAGTIGAPGQGGGGGGGAAGEPNKGAGGGGGCGGCGGAPGGAAQGGGASVALLAFESTITVKDASLTSAKAGNGGTGAAGQDGQVGGNGGNPSSGGCQGGKGGKGGKGGASAGGAGGVSAAVLYKGSKPITEGTTTLKPGTKGSKGIGGVAGTNDGPDGNSSEAIEAP